MTTFGIVVDEKSICQIPNTRRNPQYLELARKPATIISQRSCRLFSKMPKVDPLLPPNGMSCFHSADMMMPQDYFPFDELMPLPGVDEVSRHPPVNY
jgi:hypothetical protein